MTDIELALIEYDGDRSKPYCDIIYNALKKQQPAKINWDSGFPRCSKCEKIVYYEAMPKPIYCLFCGQKLNLT